MGEGDGIGLTIPILRWEEKRPRMGRSAGAASFLALGGIVGGRRSAAMRPEEWLGFLVGSGGSALAVADRVGEMNTDSRRLGWAGLGCEMGDD